MTQQGSPPAAGDGAPLRRFGHYELLRELGRGAQGVVHLAEDTLLGRRVALKLLVGSGAQSKEVRDRFQREAKLTSKLNHPGICGLYEVGEVEGIPFLAMQYVPGQTLAELLKMARDEQQLDASRAAQSISVMGRSSKGELEDVLRLLEKAARALHVAHEAGLVHRDIKPHNIMVTPEGDPVLLDFGLARDLDAEGQTLTASGTVMGTPAYLAPEQIVADREHIDRRTDIYALGVTLFECLTLQRPYDAPSWDQLYHKILEAALPNPCKLNPRIPRDMRTVIEVAMERESRRRYPTALMLAEDLRRVRSFEPIQAQAANVFVRLRKWARRRPGPAATIGAATVLIGAGLGTWLHTTVERRTMVATELRTAEERLAAGDFPAAREAVTRARTWDEGAVRAVEMVATIDDAERAAKAKAERDAAVAAAAAARAQSAQSLEAYRAAQERLLAGRAELARLRGAVLGRFASDAARSDYWHKDRDHRQLQIEVAHHLRAAEEQLRLAEKLEAPFDGPSPATEEQFAAFYLERWREAQQTKDAASAAVLRAAVERHDRDRRHEAELLGRGQVTVHVTTPGAECFLFRYEAYEAVRADPVVPRLVPVPTAGIGRAWDVAGSGGHHPGDPCLVVTAVAPGSPAAAAGLRAGDLVVAIGGATAQGLFAAPPVGANGDSERGAAPQHVLPLAAINDAPATSAIDLHLAPVATEGPDRVRFAGDANPLAVPRAELRTWSAADLVQQPAPAPLELLCLHDGAPIALSVRAGETPGLSVAATAYALLCSRGNRIAPGAAIRAEAGSYLLLVRAPDCEDLRVPFVVPRLGETTVRAEPLPAGTTPPGFVYVPAGPYARGGDAEALQPAAPGLVDVPGFWIARKEHSNRDWYEFLNDPDIKARIAAALAGRQPIYLPRDVDGKILAEQGPDGAWTWKVHTATGADSPVLGVSWRDVADYVAWRNRRAELAGEPWVYALPSADEWEKAARGVDGRAFPWGDQFDPSLTICLHHRQGYLLDAPGGSEPRDESVYGVLDLAGSREEWTSARVPDRSEGQQQATYHKLGGSWSVAVPTVFRSASRPFAGETRAAAQTGFRLVARHR